MYTCEVFHILFSMSEQHTSQSFVYLLKSQRISSHFVFFFRSLVFVFRTTLEYFLFIANNISIQINTRISFVAPWRFFHDGSECMLTYIECARAEDT